MAFPTSFNNILIAMVNTMVSADEWGRGQVPFVLMSDSTIHCIKSLDPVDR